MIDSNKELSNVSIINRQLDLNKLTNINLAKVLIDNEVWAKGMAINWFQKELLAKRKKQLTRLQQLISQHNYLGALRLLAEPELFVQWQEIVSTKGFAIAIANNTEVGSSILFERPVNTYMSDILDIIITSNFKSFILAILASNAFANDQYNLAQRYFILHYCHTCYFKANAPANNLATNVKAVTFSMLKAFYQNTNYRHLSDSGRNFIDNLAVESSYSETGLSFFKKVAKNGSYKLTNLPDFVCHRQKDLNELDDWINSSSQKQIQLDCLRANISKIKLGWFKRIVNKECQKAIHSEVYDILVECSN